MGACLRSTIRRRDAHVFRGSVTYIHGFYVVETFLRYICDIEYMPIVEDLYPFLSRIMSLAISLIDFGICFGQWSAISCMAYANVLACLCVSFSYAQL